MHVCETCSFSLRAAKYDQNGGCQEVQKFMVIDSIVCPKMIFDIFVDSGETNPLILCHDSLPNSRRILVLQ